MQRRTTVASNNGFEVVVSERLSSGYVFVGYRKLEKLGTISGSHAHISRGEIGTERNAYPLRCLQRQYQTRVRCERTPNDIPIVSHAGGCLEEQRNYGRLPMRQLWARVLVV